MVAYDHLTGPDDLVTSHKATRDGFLRLVEERNQLVLPFLDDANDLRTAAARAGSIEECVSDLSMRSALLAAAGVSEKAAGHLSAEEMETPVRKLVQLCQEHAGGNFVDELVYRFLLTKGDAVGGKARNAGGKFAKERFFQAMVAAIESDSDSYYWVDHRKIWHLATEAPPNYDNGGRGLNWASHGRNRTLLLDRKVPAVGMNVDLCLLNCQREQAEIAVKNAGAFLALGELKGGIDPAGADEHWKTAKTALNRILAAFSEAEAYPALFFIGAAVAKNMATEIWERLEKNTLANAANLTDDDQLAAIARWVRML